MWVCVCGTGGGGGREGGQCGVGERVLHGFLLAAASSDCDPRTLSLYHSMFSCNFATLAILHDCLCNVCATEAYAL